MEPSSATTRAGSRSVTSATRTSAARASPGRPPEKPVGWREVVGGGVPADGPAPLIKVGGMPAPRDGRGQALADRLHAGERCRKAKHGEVHEELAAVHVLILSGAVNFCLQR